MQVPVERFDPLFPADVLGRFDDGHLPFLGEALHELMVVRGDRLEVIRRQVGRQPFFLEEADHTGRILQHLNHRVQQDTIKARVREPDVVLVVFDKSVHRGPPFMAGWLLP